MNRKFKSCYIIPPFHSFAFNPETDNYFKGEKVSYHQLLSKISLSQIFSIVNRGKVEKQVLFDKNLLTILQHCYLFHKVKRMYIDSVRKVVE